jgi:hypothetical protein
MPLSTQSIASVHTDLEDQPSALSPLLQNGRIGSEEPVELHQSSRSVADLAGRLHLTHDHIDEEIELEEIRDDPRVERCAGGTEAVDPSM